MRTSTTLTLTLLAAAVTAGTALVAGTAAGFRGTYVVPAAVLLAAGTLCAGWLATCVQSTRGARIVVYLTVAVICSATGAYALGVDTELLTRVSGWSSVLAAIAFGSLAAVELRRLH